MSDNNNVYYDSENSPEKQSNGFGIASMVCGILSIVTCCIWFVGVILAIVSIVLGIMQIRKNQKKGMAIAGIICSLVALALLIITFALGNTLENSSFYQDYMNILEENGYELE